MVANSTCIKTSAYKSAARIDIQIEITPVPFKEISKAAPGEPSAAIRERLIHQYAEPDEASIQMLRLAMERLSLSARAYSRILKVARTIADLAGSEKVESMHIAEAIGYRNLDRGDWAERGIYMIFPYIFKIGAKAVDNRMPLHFDTHSIFVMPPIHVSICRATLLRDEG